ncbi:hypothetical protein [Chitinimonas sp. BJB300]|uniref:hypothetical protein n=1 Tax=Chitinimonas sp. BJB300 TaxID=1559339 RepID=UPI0011123004|nr:hypothetical protein [Chitinimonas sp. BJB300]TSJ91157.1 hypothetical protein FG002_002340 [Chitinimonas sp. BJB300]
MSMRPTNRIDHFLPIRFKNGAVVKQFSKPCIKCGQLLQARHMHGIARLLEDHLAMAATAHCPACHTQFGVACVIDNEKRVRRVVLPLFLFKLYLRTLAMHPDEVAAHEQALADIAKAQTPVIKAEPVDYPRAGSIIGRYGDKPIPAYIVVDGREVPFDRIEADGQVNVGEYLLDGCFVYKPAHP